jgi:3'(2'), 5'-bisphosphate nucleotidase
MNELLKLAIQAALDAGAEILRIYDTEDLGIELKEDESPLTKADIASNKVITHHLSSTNIPILSEEGRHHPYSERKEHKQLWIVDPIDGTKEFIKRNGEFTVNIALIEDGSPILGVIYVPVLKELYFANKENGSYKASPIEPNSDPTLLFQDAIKLPLESTRDKYTVVASRSHLTSETTDFIEELKVNHGEIELISKGSSLKLCLVAEGSADCYPRFAPTMEWDIAAGHAICKYSGVEVMDLQTKQVMRYNREELRNNWFLIQRN